MKAHVTKIVLDRKQTAFIEAGNAVAVVSGTVDEIGRVLADHESTGCEIVFSLQYSPNATRTMNAFVKRAGRIAAVAGKSISEPREYFIDGFRQIDKFVVAVN